MTTTPTPEPTVPAIHEGDPADEPHPLSAYVKGTLRFHFAGGAVVEREGSQQDARAVLAMQQDEQTNDRIGWESLHWFQWQPSHLVFSSYDAHPDQNWAIDPGERQKLANAGHRHGVISSLVGYWELQDRRTEPAYSVRAIVALHQFARDGVDRKTWEAAARALEGRRGAALFAQAGVRPTQPLAADDLAEPDDAPESEEPEAPASTGADEHASADTDAAPDGGPGQDTSADSEDGDA